CYRDWSSDVCSSDLEPDTGATETPDVGRFGLPEPIETMDEFVRAHPDAVIDDLDEDARASRLRADHDLAAVGRILHRVLEDVVEIGRASCRERGLSR